MTGQTGWLALLDGADADRAKEAIDAIAADVDAIAPRLPARLFDGQAGAALLFHALGDAGRAEQLAERAIAGAGALGPWPYGGYTGVAWLLDEMALAGDGDPNEPIDEALVELLSISPWRQHYDLVFGLVGYARYGLDRPPGTRGGELVERAVLRLDEIAERRGEGAAARTPAALLSASDRAATPGGHFALGLAHGLAGVVALLCEVVERQVGSADHLTRSRDLLRDCAGWLAARRVTDPAGFPPLVTPEGEAEPPVKPGWCTGGPGVALSLLRASAIVSSESMRDGALSVLRDVADRAGDQALLVDAAMCHGHAGLALILARAAAITGDARLRQGARRAFLAVLDRRRPGRGIGGYERPGRDAPVADPGLQTGAVGVALALLASIAEDAPRWDRLFLLSSG